MSAISSTYYPKPGVVTVYAKEMNNNGALVVDPYGNPVDTVGTQTQGIQEAIDYAIENQFNVHIAGLNSTLNSSYYQCDVGLVIPAVHEFSLTSDAVTINFASSVTTGILFDSCDGMQFDLKGQIVFNATSGQCLRFYPQNPAPTDEGAIFNVSSRFKFGQIVMNALTGTAIAVVFDGAASGSQQGTILNYFHFDEINNGAYAFLVNLTNAQFNRNWISSQSLHDQRDGIIAPSSTNLMKTLATNKWTFTYPLSATVTAISVGASPFEYRNSSLMPQTVTVNAGTLNGLQVGTYANGSFVGAAVGNQTVGGAFYLSPGHAIQVSYSVAPDMNFFWAP